MLDVGAWSFRHHFAARTDPVYAAMGFVAEGGLVSIAFAGGKAARSRVVLDDVIIPINDPQHAIRADFGADRGGPFVIAGGEVSAVMRGEIGSARLEVKFSQHMTGRLSDELNAVPIFFG